MAADAEPGRGPLSPDRMFRLLAENASDVVLLADTETDMLWVSPSARDLLGWEPEQLVGHRAAEFIHPDDMPQVRRSIGSSAVSGEPVLLRYRWRRPDGSYVWVQAAGKPVRDAEEGFDGRVVRLRDISAEVDLIAALDTERARLSAAIDSMLDPYIVVSPVVAEDGHVVDLVFTLANAAASRYLRVPESRLVSGTLTDLFGSERSAWLVALADRTVSTGRPVELDGLRTESVVDGSERWLDLRAVFTGEDIGVTWRDVTDRVRAQLELDERARTDPLTGALNRGEVLDRLGTSLDGSPRPGRTTAVLYCDLDELKQVNDTYGHSAGDELISRVVSTIESCVREGDEVGRIGGDEILVVLEGVDQAAAVQTAERIRASVAALAVGSALAPATTVSVGVALAQDGEPASALVDRADHAMYVAKRGGRDRVVLAD